MNDSVTGLETTTSASLELFTFPIFMDYIYIYQHLNIWVRQSYSILIPMGSEKNQATHHDIISWHVHKRPRTSWRTLTYPDVSWRPDVAKESAGFTDDHQRMLASKLAGWPSIQRKIGTNDSGYPAVVKDLSTWLCPHTFLKWRWINSYRIL